MSDMDFRSLLISLTLMFGLAALPGHATDKVLPLSAAGQAPVKSAGEGESAISAEQKAVFKEAEALKKEIVELNRELYHFEEELLYPANSQVSVFLSIDAKTGFVLDSIELQINDSLVTSHLYSENEINALKRGGVQRLYIGSLSDGAHKITVQVNGLGANNRYFRNKQRASITKQNSAKYIELVIAESGPSREPTTKIKQW